MTLNTYAKSLPYFTLKPRAKVFQSDLAITFPRDVRILSGYIWTGYDQGSQFEAGCRVWLKPSISFLSLALLILRKLIRHEWFSTVSVFSGSVMLGGVYLHKHNTTQTAYQNDFYQLQQLRGIQPVSVRAGSQIVIDRDIFNIDRTKTFNAFDVELILVVDE